MIDGLACAIAFVRWMDSRDGASPPEDVLLWLDAGLRGWMHDAPKQHCGGHGLEHWLGLRKADRYAWLRSRRDDLLRDAARLLAPGDPPARQAARLADELKSFEWRKWPLFDDLTRIPAVDLDPGESEHLARLSPVDAVLLVVFRLGLPIPRQRQLHRILRPPCSDTGSRLARARA